MFFKFFEIQICSLLNNIIFVIQNVNSTTINLTNGTDAWRDYFLKDDDIFTGTFSQKRLNSKSIIYCFTWKWNRERTHRNFVARMIKYGRTGSLRHAHAEQLKDRLGALSLFELFWTANPSSETNGHRGICANGPGNHGYAAGHVPPSPILIPTHTSFRGVAEQCLSCVQINHCVAAVHQIALWSLATIPIREPWRVRMSLGIIDLLASGFVYDRDMPTVGGSDTVSAIMRKIRQLWSQCAWQWIKYCLSSFFYTLIVSH